jgi:hypothetical protein
MINIEIEPLGFKVWYKYNKKKIQENKKEQ